MKRTVRAHPGKESRHKSGYGGQHQKLREQLLHEEPLCRMCKAQGRITPASIDDHIVPFSNGGAAYEISKLQPGGASMIDEGCLRSAFDGFKRSPWF
jgi:5-methylcytosine-specific restriction endonuclease McrA